MDKIDVWNSALRLLHMPRVNVTTPVDEATRLLNDGWNQAVSYSLELGDWDFARERGELSRVLPAPVFGYTYFYQVPSDSLRLVFVSETGDRNDPLLSYAHEGNKIATDAKRVFAIWVSREAIETPGRWSTAFAMLVAAHLAKECLALNPSQRDDVEEAMKRAKASAHGLDGVQNPPQRRRPGQWSTAIQTASRGEQGGWRN